MKKIVSILLTGCLCILSFPPDTYGAFFNDTDDKDVEIEFLAESGVIVGRTEGKFMPESLLNRAEIMKILLESIGISPDPDIYKDCFPDVSDEWFAPYVCYAYAQGWVEGYPDGTFKPADYVNLAEASKMAFNTFEVEFEKLVNDLEWYSTFVNGGEEYNVLDQEYEPWEYISREAMAEIVVRAAVISITQQKFNLRALSRLRNWEKSIQNLADAANISNLRKNLEDMGVFEWTVKISSNNGNRFEILFADYDDPFISMEGAENLSLPPYIEIEEDTGITDIGINADFSWDGLISPSDLSALVDADLLGFFDASINLEFLPEQKIVYIYSNLKKKSGTFDLETGEVSGNHEITQGIENLNDFFTESNGEPFTVCVSDVEGLYGEIGIFDDFETVGVRECPYYKVEEEEPINFSYIPPIVPIVGKGLVGLGKNPFPRGGGGGNQGGAGGNGGANGSSGGAGDSMDSVWSEPTDEIFEPEPVEKGNLEPIPEPEDPFPTPKKHPGKGYDIPEYSWKIAEKNRKNAFEANDQNCKALEKDSEKFERNKEILEELIKKFDLNKPASPNLDISDCCQEYEKTGSCCSNIDFSTNEGREKYKERIDCLYAKRLNILVDANELLKTVNYWASRMGAMQKARGAFKLLEGFADVEKKAIHAVIDIASGGAGQWLKGKIGGYIEEKFGNEAGFAYNSANNKSVKKTIKDNAKEKAKEIVMNMVDYKKKIAAIVEKIADAVGVTGPKRDRLVKDLNERFCDNYENLFNPAEWLKAIAGAILADVAGGAEEVVNSIDKIEEKLNKDLLAAWEKADLLIQLNKILKKIRCENCGPDYLKALKDRVDKLKKIEEGYYDGLAEDKKYFEKAIQWVMKNHCWELVELGSIEKMKERVLELLHNYLCKLGYDLCWFDIVLKDFKCEEKIGEMGSRICICEPFTFDYDKRETKKDPCECLDEDSDVDTDVDTDEDTDEGAYADDVDDDDFDDIVDDDFDFALDQYCLNLSMANFVGDVTYDSSSGAIMDTLCGMLVLESEVLDKMTEFYGENNAWNAWECFTSMTDCGVVFSFSDGKFYLENEEIFCD